MTGKYALIHAEEGNHTITLMCQLLRIERTGYHSWRAGFDTAPAADSRAARRTHLVERIKDLWKQSRRAHGARRLQVDPREEGHPVSAFFSRTDSATDQAA